jgi:DNA polymerase-3 subunit epsilon
MNLKLKRPLVIFDLETTGTDVGKDRILEIALLKIMPDGQRISWPAHVGREHRFIIHPGIPIPLTTSLIHGIYDADVKDAPSFSEIAPKLFKFIFDCDLGGFNSNRFDIPLLAEEFLRAGIDFSIEGIQLVDVQELFHFMEQRTLKAAYKFYCNKSLDNAHEALPDVLATFDVLDAMIERYQDVQIPDQKGNLYYPVQPDVETLHAIGARKRRADLAGHIAFNDDEQPMFNFGKYKHQTLMEVFRKDPGYYGWLMQADFPMYTKKVVSAWRDKYRDPAYS